MKVNLDDLNWVATQNDGFCYARKQLGKAAGGRLLGTSVFKLEPGAKAFPYHHHYANEEAIFILSGSGSLRLNGETLAVHTHDYIALPPGKNFSHQLINNSPQALIYLVVSTMFEPEVIAYPDSKKIGVMTGVAPGGVAGPEASKAFFPEESAVDYYFGEK